jgi:uncharacterized membrane protein YczE
MYKNKMSGAKIGTSPHSFFHLQVIEGSGVELGWPYIVLSASIMAQVHPLK